MEEVPSAARRTPPGPGGADRTPGADAIPAAGEPQPLLRVLGPDGGTIRPISGEPAARRELFVAMLRARLVEERLRRLSREAWIGFVPTTFGEEAALVASVDALGDDAWIFPSPRDRGALLARGIGFEPLADQLFGNADDPQKGRQMPGVLGSRGHRIACPSAPGGVQLTHATGFAWAGKLKGAERPVGALFGPGEATSSDFHTALNFAAVHRVPVVFVGRSVPGGEGGDGGGLARRGIAYGVSALRADGGDALAVQQVVGEAGERARAGHGPTLVELVVERLGDAALDGPADPLTRLRVHLGREGLLDDAQERELREGIKAELQSALESAAQKAAPPLASLFDDVQADRPNHLREQLAGLEAQAEDGRGRG